MKASINIQIEEICLLSADWIAKKSKELVSMQTTGNKILSNDYDSYIYFILMQMKKEIKLGRCMDLIQSNQQKNKHNYLWYKFIYSYTILREYRYIPLYTREQLSIWNQNNINITFSRCFKYR